MSNLLRIRSGTAATRISGGGKARIGHWVSRIAELGTALLGGFRTTTYRAGESCLDGYERGSPPLPAILLLHGFSGDKSIWLRFARLLPAGFRLLIPDLAGHGRNPSDPTLDYGIQGHARRTIAMLDTQQIDRVHLVGSSMGGLIAATVAAEHPERIASITLLSPAGVPGAQVESLDRQAAAGCNPFLIEDQSDFDILFRMIMQRPPYTPHVVKAWLCAHFSQRRTHLAQMYQAYERSLGLPCVYSRVLAPALVIWGREDAVFDVRASSALLEAMPRADLQVCDGVGHLPMLEAPVQVAELVTRFLAQVMTAPAHPLAASAT